MSMCKDCSKMVQFKRHASGHLGLERNFDADDGTDNTHRHSYYSCRICGTQWSFLNDKSDPRAGWNTLLPDTPRTFVLRHFR